LCTRGADALVIAGSSISGDRHDRHVFQLLISPKHLHQLDAGDKGQLDIGNDQIGLEGARRLQCVAAVGHRLGFVAMRRQQVAEQLDVEGIVLDNQDLGQAIPPEKPTRR